MSRHIHWYYYYDIVVSLTQTTLGPAIINILTRWPQIYTNIVWGHLISALCNLCMAQLWVEGRRRWWLLRLESSWWWRTEMTSTAIYSNQRVYLWLLYWSCLGRLNTITSFTLCSQSGGAGCRECEVELSRVCHDVTRRSVTEMETVTRAGHWTPAHCATAIVDSSSLQQICCG